MINFEIFTLKLKLFDSEGVLIPNMKVKVQFFDSQNDEWTTVYITDVLDGKIDMRRVNSTSTPQPEATFFSMIMYDKIPLVRIVPENVFPGISKQIVIASLYSFGIISPGTFEMDFGTLYGLPKERISDDLSSFKDILPVTSFFRIGSGSSTPETVPVPINSLYTDLVSEIASATQLSVDSPFKLSNISLKLKTLIHKDGENMSASLLDMSNSENINGNAISELVFDITPNQGTEAVNAERMPDLTGLTETAVRKTLQKYNLKLNPVYQQNLDVVNGAAFKQSPAARGRTPENQIVTVIFSKNEQS